MLQLIISWCMQAFDSSYVRVSTITAVEYVRSQIKVHTDERTQFTARGLPWLQVLMQAAWPVQYTTVIMLNVHLIYCDECVELPLTNKQCLIRIQ